MKEINENIMSYLSQWDPLGYGKGSYETEVVDVLQAVHELNEVRQLAKRIQFIYEFSFEEMIPIDSCRSIAGKLLRIKEQQSCSI